jgi:hypothetical protein
VGLPVRGGGHVAIFMEDAYIEEILVIYILHYSLLLVLMLSLDCVSLVYTDSLVSLVLCHLVI